MQTTFLNSKLRMSTCALTPNHLLRRSDNGRPPNPVWRYAVHFRQPGFGVLPLSPAWLERYPITAPAETIGRLNQKFFGRRAG